MALLTRPDEAFFIGIADKVATLLLEKANRERFIEQCNIFAGLFAERREAMDKQEEADAKHYDKVRKTPRLGNKKAGPPKRGWEWREPYLQKISLQPQDSVPGPAWYPPAKPPPRIVRDDPFDRNPPRDFTERLPHDYCRLAIIHNLFRPDCVPIPTEKWHHCLKMWAEGPDARCSLEGHEDFTPKERIERALEQVAADLAMQVVEKANRTTQHILAKGSGDAPPILHQDALAILRLLAKSNTYVKQLVIATTIGKDVGTVRTRLKELRGHGFTKKHKRTGEAIMPKGREYLKSLPA